MKFMVTPPKTAVKCQHPSGCTKESTSIIIYDGATETQLCDTHDMLYSRSQC